MLNLTTKSNSTFPSTRRVSFDLTHNVVYFLPTFEECRDAEKRVKREEWQRKTLNEDMLSEDIIVEIQKSVAGSRTTHAVERSPATVELKSCLKKPPVVRIEEKKKKPSKKTNQKKRKRTSLKSHIDQGKTLDWFFR
ncbi:hypothetical protein G6F46_011735 [Rhizopus delemar]|uniref:Uncharacterized protein n=2 Tax=Rhizopus TaxID=4842 RepID=A0A9P7CR99_9FUNG|nr:hypothetical protein G6F55_009981 [Rhizopus delemar]KAG1534885.1 hypothetical protein G6F51_011839 [Rhizopus arrhizus]KAG1489309.1 hypothetical protein G6F54_011530 [Rhizopus delemar]KAG1494702.1 hypothetical protein G6F52_013107 [Rhizopus delemar]KAG1498998.1 hypothetical protein G6F53_011617 [Rhizopus delemar]